MEGGTRPPIIYWRKSSTELSNGTGVGAQGLPKIKGTIPEFRGISPQQFG